MDEPTFDIFRGVCDKDAVWVERFFELSDARHRMEEIARATPERYFVFGRSSQSVLARIDTRKSVVIPFVPKNQNRLDFLDGRDASSPEGSAGSEGPSAAFSFHILERVGEQLVELFKSRN